MDVDEIKVRVKFIVSTKAELITEKVNQWLDEHEDDIDLVDILPFMSYTSITNKGAMMIGAMIKYYEYPSLEIESIKDHEGIIEINPA